MTQWNYCPECARALVVDEQKPERPVACPSGHFVKYDNPLPSTIAVIRRDERYLLLKRAHPPAVGEWGAVGGFLQGAESPEECLIREAREETGLAIRPEGILGVYPSIYGDTGLKTVGIAYECSFEEGEVTLSDENSDFGWFTADELPELAFPDVRAAYEPLRRPKR